MRVFFSAGEASGDAYGAEILAAMDRRGAFSDQALAGGLLSYAVRLFSSDLKGATDWIADIYAGGRDGSFLERLPELSPKDPPDRDDIVREIVLDVAEGRIDRVRLMAETVFAVGGKRLRGAGAALVADSSDWGAVGIMEALRVAPKAISGFDEAKRRLTKHDPGLFVPIDFGFTNVKLARIAKAAGWKVLYFAPPGSWRRDKQGADLPAVTDAIVTPFPWSAAILNRMGADARFFGHPLKQMIRSVPEAPGREGVTFLPGSRKHEVRHNLPVMAAVARSVGGPVRIGVAPNLNVESMERQWEALGGPSAEFTTDGRMSLKQSQAAVVCSGTATLEAALCKCPMVVVYRVSKFFALEYLIRRPKIGFIALPNIILDRPVVPELIQIDATAGRILSELGPLMQDTAERRSQLEGFEEIDEVCGSPDCFEQTADLAMTLARGLV